MSTDLHTACDFSLLNEDMVKTDDRVADGWREVFERSRMIPPPGQTARLAAERHLTESSGFRLRLGRLAAAHLPQDTSVGGKDVNYQLRVTLFDKSHQHFFGTTWKSSPQKMKNNKILFDEVLYFHTSLRLPSTVVILELVALSNLPDGSQQALGRGFTVLDLFTNRPDIQAADEDRRLKLHHGTPRSLLHPLLRDRDQYHTLLKIIDGTHLECLVKKHPAMVSLMHLLPENVFVSGDQNIPGLAVCPSGDSLLRPRLLQMLPLTLNRLTVWLQPSLDSFERQLLQLINADCLNTKQSGPEGTLRTVVIQERRLHVGVHNGWCFLEKPQVVVLEPLAPRARDGASGTSKSKDSSALSPVPQMLGLRSNLELKLINHRALAVVFQLEYVFSAPIGRDTMLSATSTSRAAFLQCLRWGIWCPFHKLAEWKGEEIRLVLHGGTKPNPHGVMVYSTEMSAKTQSPVPHSTLSTAQVSEAKDMLSFRFWTVLERKASSLKASLKTKQEDVSCRRSFSSPSQSQKHIPLPSPESPQGPGLSLSQLTATSRYPTISQSSSLSPWQQPVPSLLHPSPLASAHQLSHVAFSSASSITHTEPDLQSDGKMSSSLQDEGDRLRDLPFTPVHAPVITLGTSVPSSVSSRSSMAYLYSADFPDIVDSTGKVAEVLDSTEPVLFDPQREETDPLQGNLLVFQFLAFSRIPTVGVVPDWPDNIYFTFQFYRFPPVTSQHLKLLTNEKDQQKVRYPLPCFLTSIDRSGNVNAGPLGLQMQFRVDSSFLKPGEKRWFLQYLALHTMHIDIWDSDSLLLIGSTAIQLKYMLRQGKSAVQALHEVEVLTTDYAGEDTVLMRTIHDPSSAATPTTVHTVLRGRMHIRTGNTGFTADPSQKTAGDVTVSHSYIITPREVTCTFRGGSLPSRNILHQNGTHSRNTAQAQRREMDVNRLVSSRSQIKPDTSTPDDPNSDDPDDGCRKLSIMAAVHQQESKEDPTAAKVTGLDKDAQRIREPLWIKCNEERSKADGIANMLSQAITTQHILYASLGSAEYMEFVLKNPFSVPQTVTICSDDPELSVITNTDEWRYFKGLTKTPTLLEDNMFHLEDGAAGPRVYLRPKESIHVPLKYQTFLCDHTVVSQGQSFLPAGRSCHVAKKNPSNLIVAKSVKVTFKTDDGKPLAICQVNVEPTPHVVDQTFRLYHPELCFLKKAIRLSPWHDPASNKVGVLTSTAPISVRCSDQNVICHTERLVPGEPQDVYLKVPGIPSPHIKIFFVMLFTDQWMAAPSQIWQIYVHFLERVDVSCVTGQRGCQSLLLRGKQAIRKVKCFSSHPQEIELDPGGVFVLPPAAVQELQLKVQPWRAGSRFLYVNAVDVDQRRLVTAWLLCLTVHRPVISKAFEVCVPVGGSRGSSRKITYTNPYTSSRTFLLRSDHPDLLRFKEDKVQIGGGETYTIGLRFAPSQSTGSVEMLVYMNDLDEKTEETYCVKVNYS
ncbi:nephrocystin-4 [Thalassophryne amazonica]|uniref:nephrocystin-4 n=1 Tax=Thalassophryne amazonica TaxID=390379 RepID=UPI0014713883|nr:nephrocystin-4 [Thalassophryne amazonica]